MNHSSAALDLARHLSWLSLISFGGIPVVLPEIHDFVVVVNAWASDREFADFFALSQIMPGPNFIFMLSLIGWRIGGVTGAVAATLGIAGPACMLTFVAFRLWHRFRDAPWRLAASRGLVPLTIGLVVAGGWVLARAGHTGWRGMALTAAAAALTLRSRINPLLVLSAGGVLGGLGAI